MTLARSLSCALGVLLSAVACHRPLGHTETKTSADGLNSTTPPHAVAPSALTASTLPNTAPSNQPVRPTTPPQKTGGHSGSKWPSAVTQTSPAETSRAAQPAALPVAMGAELGKSATEVTGCLALPTARQEAAAVPPTRSMRKNPDWRVTTLGKTIVVTHDLTHACCLTSATHTSLTGNVLTISESLSGNACRCQCESTIQTRVPVAPGDYSVKLEVSFNGNLVTTAELPQRVAASVRDLAH